MELVNTRLLSHPANWFIVWTVIAFAGFAFMILHTGLAQFPISGAVVRPSSN